MAFSVRPAVAADFDRMIELVALAFNERQDPDLRDSTVDLLEKERFFALEDGDQIVGCCGNIALELTVPGGAFVPMTGVTWVVVLPTHHRRGGLTLMMKELLDDGRAHDEPVAGLWASESIIYRRYGYGIASRTARTQIEVRRADFRQPRERTGSMQLIAAADAPDILTPLIDELRRHRNGMVSIPGHLVRRMYERKPEGEKQSLIAIHRDDAGKADGLIRYTVSAGNDFWLANSEVNVSELWGVTPAVEIELWRYALDVDFAGSLVGVDRPVDEPIVELLADPRRWQVFPRDALHLRILDIDRFLSARRYLREGEITLEVVHPDGARTRHRLQGGPNDANCVGTDSPADLVVDMPILGSAYLGDVPLERVFRAGLIEERTTGAVELASAMFLWTQLPWSGHVF